MSEPFLAEIRLIGFNFAPHGWAFCDGQILPINQNQSLYSLLGTTYGGDGQTSFALPDIRGRVPIHKGNGFQLGQKDGEETHTLAAHEMPNHDHQVQGASVNADTRVPDGNRFARALNAYTSPQNLTQLASGTVANAGGGQAHENMQPFLALNYVIALQGLFPSMN